jgi:kynureninase
VTNWEFSLDCAKKLDKNDELSSFRDLFYLPTFTKNDVVYFTGNSLGLQPKTVKNFIQKELDDWAKWGVEGHVFAKNPWMPYHELFTSKIAKIVGAKDSEVAVTHSLTTNLHLLMVSFYRPKNNRTKILCEKKAFPSDQYALQSQVKFHGLNPNDCIVEIGAREGEHLIRTEDIISKIEELSDELAMVMIGGVNYFTGQVFDMKSITESGHKVGSKVGFDLAHAAGNIPLKLNEWNVDFAAWCSYKYLNSGPGGVSGYYINEKHVTNPDIPRFAGWWGHNKDDRFKMPDEFSPIPTAESWQLSNAPVISMAAHLASLEIFEKAGMEKLRDKSISLTNYLEFIVEKINMNNGNCLEIITPKDINQRGCQLSIVAHGSDKVLFDKLSENGVVADWREPNVIRIAPVPLYNNYEDVYRFGEILEKSL